MAPGGLRLMANRVAAEVLQSFFGNAAGARTCKEPSRQEMDVPARPDAHRRRTVLTVQIWRACEGNRKPA
jgi:hypothetical protein